VSDIDEILNSINQKSDEEKTDLEKSVEQSVNNTPQKKEDDLPDVSEDDEMMKFVLKTVLEDRSKADDLYNVFLPEVAQGRDRSTASKEAMAKAIELKISAAKNIIEMMKLKKQETRTSVGVFMGDAISSKKAGINIQSIQDELDD